MGSDHDGVVEKVEGHIVKVIHPGVKSALKLMRDIPEIYDVIYDLFPKIYSHGFGRISGVRTIGEVDDEAKQANKSTTKRYLSRAPKTKFYQHETTHSYGEGFIYPLVVALRELMTVNVNGEVLWAAEPKAFLKEHGKQIMESYKDMISGQNYDPGKVGKTKGSYNVVARSFRQILDAKELEKLKAQLAASK
jgi:hypothetical protein